MREDSGFEFWCSLIGRAKTKKGEAPLKFIELQQGETLCRQGDAVTGVFLVKSGKIKCLMHQGKGKTRLLHVAVKNDYIGHKPVLLGNKAFTHTWVAWEDALLLYIPQSVFLKEVESNPARLMVVARLLGASLHEMEMNLAGLNIKPVMKRVAYALLWLDSFFNGSPIQMNRTEFGELIGTATETGIRMLSILKRKKLIIARGKYIRVVDKKGLQQLLDGKKPFRKM